MSSFILVWIFSRAVKATSLLSICPNNDLLIKFFYTPKFKICYYHYYIITTINTLLYICTTLSHFLSIIWTLTSYELKLNVLTSAVFEQVHYSLTRTGDLLAEPRHCHLTRSCLLLDFCHNWLVLTKNANTVPALNELWNA